MKYFLAIITGFALLTGAYFLLYVYSPFRNPEHQVRTFVGLYDYKESLLKTASPPRLIVLAGSNGLYGINTKKISGVLHFPAYNECVSLLMDLDYTLYNARHYLQKGDIVLLALEYEYYGGMERNATTTGVVLQRDRGYFLQLPFPKKMEWLFGEPMNGIYDGLFLPKTDAAQAAALARKGVCEHLNDHGDFVGHTSGSSPLKPADLLARGAINIAGITSGKTSPEAWQCLRRFVGWCDAAGVRVLATFPSTVRFPEYGSQKSKAAFQGIVEKYHSLGVPTIGTPEDFLWDVSKFYDLGYHLNEEAMNEHTDIIISLLAPYLGTTSR